MNSWSNAGFSQNITGEYLIKGINIWTKMKLKSIAVSATNGIMICQVISFLPGAPWDKVIFKKCLTLRTDDFLAALMVNNTIPIQYKYHVSLIASGASLLGENEISSIGGRTSPGVRCDTIVTVTAYSTFWEMEMIVSYTFINRLFLIFRSIFMGGYVRS